jgi:hypothetical protein
MMHTARTQQQQQQQQQQQCMLLHHVWWLRSGLVPPAGSCPSQRPSLLCSHQAR